MSGIAAGVFLLLCGCGQGAGEGSGGAPSSSAVAEQSGTSSVPVEPESKTLAYAVSGLPVTLDSAFVTSALDAEFLYHTSEGLLRLNGNTVEAGLAESWDVDGATYTFHLRDARWEDGEPVTAEHFAFALRRLLNPDTGAALSDGLMVIKNAFAYRAGNVDVSELGIEAVDEKTLRIELESEAPYFLKLLATDYGVYPLREDVLEQCGSEYATSAGTYLACGPFRLKSWDEASVTLEKNETYWNAAAVKLQRIVCLAVPDGATRAVMYESGEIDAYVELLKGNEAHYHTSQSMSENTLVSVQLNFGSDSAGKLLSNADFRKALSYAVNRESLVGELAIGGSHATARFVSPAVTDENGGVYTDAFSMEDAPLEGDETKAKSYLKAALDALELDAADLPELEFVCYDTDAARPVAERLVSVWKDVLGLSNIKLTPLAAQDAVDRCYDREYDLYLQTCVGRYLDPYAQLSLWTPESTVNWTGWASEDYAKGLAAANGVANEQERFQKLAACEQDLIDKGPQIPLYYRGYLFDVSQRITGLQISSAGVPLQMIGADILS